MYIERTNYSIIHYAILVEYVREQSDAASNASISIFVFNIYNLYSNQQIKIRPRSITASHNLTRKRKSRYTASCPRYSSWHEYEKHLHPARSERTFSSASICHQKLRKSDSRRQKEKHTHTHIHHAFLSPLARMACSRT